MIGTKSIGLVALAILATALAAARGLVSVDHLRGLSAASCVAIGLFAALAAALAAAGVRPERPSAWAVGLVRGRLGVAPVVDRAPRELPAWVQRGLLTLTGLHLALAAFDNRATAQLLEVPARIGAGAASEYCPEPDAVAEGATAPAPSPPPAEAPGCALIVRAYELGYADDLGECAPAEADDGDAPDAAREPCTLRQRGEPWLHYTWRLLARRGAELDGFDPVASARQGAATFQIKLRYLDALAAGHVHAVTTSPRASHHLWINLPDPSPGSRLGSLVASTRCAERDAARPLWPAVAHHPRPASAIVDHVVGQLLFDSRFGPTPHGCREYTIHWGAPDDVCERLRVDPERVLAASGALDPVRAVLDRHRRHEQLRALAVELGEPERLEPAPDARRVVSLQCFTVDPAGAGEVDRGEVRVSGYPLEVRALRAPVVGTTGGGRLALYQQLATLLAGGRYGGPAATTSLERLVSGAPDAGALAGDTFLLTRLEHLRSADPFLGAAWPLDRPALTEIYPHGLHLGHFVDAFRRRYAAQRGRL